MAPKLHAMLASLLALGCLAGCGGTDAANVPVPTQQELGLDAEQSEDYDPVTLDEVIRTLDRFDEAEDPGDVEQAREDFIHQHDRHWIGWVGVVARTRIVSHDEVAVLVSAPGGSSGLIPTTINVLFEVPEDHPAHQLGRGDVVRFGGRLEFDGRSREPWVLEARLLPRL